MASYAYFEDLADMDGEIEFTAADVEASEDRGQLLDWQDALEVLADNIRGQLDAARVSGIDDDAWVFRASRALAFCNIGSGRIRRRLKSLGYLDASKDQKIANLERALQTSKAQAAFGRAFIEAARGFLPPQEFARLDREALIALEAKPKLSEAA